MAWAIVDGATPWGKLAATTRCKSDRVGRYSRRGIRRRAQPFLRPACTRDGIETHDHRHGQRHPERVRARLKAGHNGHQPAGLRNPCRQPPADPARHRNRHSGWRKVYAATQRGETFPEIG